MQLFAITAYLKQTLVTIATKIKCSVNAVQTQNIKQLRSSDSGLHCKITNFPSYFALTAQYQITEDQVIIHVCSILAQATILPY
jgi:hypothetical protein